MGQYGQGHLTREGMSQKYSKHQEQIKFGLTAAGSSPGFCWDKKNLINLYFTLHLSCHPGARRKVSEFRRTKRFDLLSNDSIFKQGAQLRIFSRIKKQVTGESEEQRHGEKLARSGKKASESTRTNGGGLRTIVIKGKPLLGSHQE